MEENTINTISKELVMDSGEKIKITVEIVNIMPRNIGLTKDFLETMFKEINSKLLKVI